MELLQEEIPSEALAGLAVREEPTTSSEPALRSTEPALRPIEPALSSTEPALSSTEPALSSTEPALRSTEPALRPIEPALSSTEPALSSTEPALRSTEHDERAARRSLRAQIGKLERELAEAFVTAYPMGGLHDEPAPSYAAPRLLDLGELERVRDDLAARLRAARATITELADRQAANRVRLERMLLEPGRYRYVRISNRDLGEPGCGVWQVRPRLGLIGMLMGWWQVKLSSGCPLATGRSVAAALA